MNFFFKKKLNLNKNQLPIFRRLLHPLDPSINLTLALISTGPFCSILFFTFPLISSSVNEVVLPIDLFLDMERFIKLFWPTSEIQRLRTSRENIILEYYYLYHLDKIEKQNMKQVAKCEISVCNC